MPDAPLTIGACCQRAFIFANCFISLQLLLVFACFEPSKQDTSSYYCLLQEDKTGAAFHAHKRHNQNEFHNIAI